MIEVDADWDQEWDAASFADSLDISLTDSADRCTILVEGQLACDANSWRVDGSHVMLRENKTSSGINGYRG
jgi:hypothetical protein